MRDTFEPFDIERRGLRIHVRSVLPSDEPEILQLFDRLGPVSRYMRFMTAKRSINVERLHSALASLPEQGFSIVATVPAADGFDIVGATSLMSTAEPGCAEFAVSIDDAWSGQGLGGVLLGALVDAARRGGLAELHGIVLAENRAMLRLAQRLGFSVARDPDDFAVRICRLPLGPPAP